MNRPFRFAATALGALVAGLCAAPLSAQPTITYLHENAPWVQEDAREFEAFGAALATGDFNDDGLADLVIGVPYAQSGALAKVGGAHVLYSRLGSGPFPLGQYWDQFLVCSERVEVNDIFGWAFAVGDFDGDGSDDLAIGSWGDDVGEYSSSGLVQILFGRAGYGLDNGRCQTWHQDRPGVADRVEDGDHFGQALAAGDFNGDGVDDLAIGVPSESLPGADFAGAVLVLPGQWGVGPVTTGSLWLQEGTTLGGFTLSGTPSLRGHFGVALVSGDFNGDGVADLAIGSHKAASQGSVHVILGFLGVGLTGRAHQLWQQGFGGLPDAAEPADSFGSSLATGDFNRDGFDDLAIGAWGEGFAGLAAVGAVHVLNGSSIGLRAPGAFFTQDTGTIQDLGEANDYFGYSLAGGDFNGDGFDDLAIGAPIDNLAETFRPGGGVVHILNGSAAGITPQANRAWGLESPGVGGEPSSNAIFGWALAAADFDGDGAADLAIGAPQDDPRLTEGGAIGIINAGSVNVFGNLDELAPILLLP